MPAASHRRATTPLKAGRRATQKEAVRKRIVKAALELFQSRGFDATTTRQIAKRAKLAEGTIFNHFETKEDIALHFLELEVDHAIAAVRGNARLRKAPLDEKLFALVEAQLEYIAPYERFIGAAFVHALRPTSRIAFSVQAIDLRNRYLAFVQELIDESPSVPPGTLAFVAPLAFWIFYLGMLLYWLNDASAGKQNTLALLDRSLKLGVAMLRKGAF
jgi:AcrR family transcriptional regulator